MSDSKIVELITAHMRNVHGTIFTVQYEKGVPISVEEKPDTSWDEEEVAAINKRYDEANGNVGENLD